MKKTLLAAGLVAFASASAVSCGGRQQHIANLPLEWRGVGSLPKASSQVESAFAKVPIRIAPFADIRTDTKAVGWYEEDGWVVRTIDDVPTYVTAKVREILRGAGAKVDDQAGTVVEGTILEYRVTEGGLFRGAVRLRVVVKHADGAPWEKVYDGTSKRWGRSHSIENYNEALSNALHEATRKMLQDEAFAAALVGSEPGAAAPAGAVKL